MFSGARSGCALGFRAVSRGRLAAVPEVVERANATRLMRRAGAASYRELVRRSRTSRTGSGRSRSRTWGSSSPSRGRPCSTSHAGRSGRPGSSAAKVSIARNCVHRWAARTPDARRGGRLAEDGSRRELTYAELSREVTRLAEALARSASARATGSRSTCRCRLRWRSPRTPARTSARSRCRSSRASPRRPSPSACRRREAKVAITRRRVVAPRQAPCRCSRRSRRRGARRPRRARGRRAVGRAPRRLPGELPALEVDSETPYLLTYTSGTTGKPKGIVHVQGGFLVSIAREVAYQADAAQGDVIHFATDMGWIMGPWTVVGGGALGRDGRLRSRARPTGRPTGSGDGRGRARDQPRALADARPRAASRTASPTHDLSSLRTFVTTGEPWNPEPYRWLFEQVGGSRVPIINCSGGTEVGACFLSPVPVGADQGVLARRARARDGDGHRRRRRPLARRDAARSASSSAASRSPA